MITHDKEKIAYTVEAIKSLESKNVKSIQIQWETNNEGTPYPNIEIVYYKKEE